MASTTTRHRWAGGRRWAVVIWLMTAGAGMAQAAASCDAVQAQCKAKPVEVEALVLGRDEATRSVDLQALDKERDAVVFSCSAVKTLPAVEALVTLKYTVVDGRRHLCDAVKPDEPAVKIVGQRVGGSVASVDGKSFGWLLLRPDETDEQISRRPAGQRPGMLRLAVTDNGLKPVVQQVKVGDRVQAVYRSDDQTPTSAGIGRNLLQLDWTSRELGGARAGFALGLALLVIYGFAWLFTWDNPARLFLGEDGRYSTSKFQAALWFWLVFAGYLASVALRVGVAGLDFIGGVGIPDNLVLLSGISVLTVAGAKAITSGKVEAAQTQPPAPTPPGVTPVPATPKYPATRTTLGDLVRDDFRRIDLGDFQSVLVTLIAVGVYGLTLVRHLSLIEFRQETGLPDLDTTLLALFGLSQGGYLGKKAAGDVGAGMTPQQAVTRAGELATAVRQAAERATLARADAGAERQKAAAALAATQATDSKAIAKSAQGDASRAALAAQGAADRCSKAQQQGQAALDELKKLVNDWRSEPAAQAATQQALDEATRQQASSDSAATAAGGSVTAAETAANDAQTEASQKTRP